MDRLLSQTNPTSVRSAIKNILRQSASEATEEGLTTLANTISDAIIMGDKSELNTAIRAYRANGYSDSDAQKKTFTDWLIGLAGDTIGGLFAAGYNVPGGIAYKRSGGDANSQNNASSNTDNANPNAEANVEQNSNTDMDPLEFAARETMKPSKEQQAMDQALQETADWMLGKEKTATAEAGTGNAGAKPKVSMDDFTNRQSEVFNNLEYGDTEAATKIMQQTHADMVQEGNVVQISEDTANQTQNYYPDLRDMKKKDRTPILKQKMAELKADLRKFLGGMKGVTYEFDVNGNVLDARLYDTGIREVMEKVTQDKASMLRHSDEIFQNARYLYSTPDYEGNPNIYRWNYFYTPVRIGDNTLGVRIAVRDVVAGQNGSPESQIYNWGIKKMQPWTAGNLAIVPHRPMSHRMHLLITLYPIPIKMSTRIRRQILTMIWAMVLLALRRLGLIRIPTIRIGRMLPIYLH